LRGRSSRKPPRYVRREKPHQRAGGRSPWVCPRLLTGDGSYRRAVKLWAAYQTRSERLSCAGTTHASHSNCGPVVCPVGREAIADETDELDPPALPGQFSCGNSVV